MNIAKIKKELQEKYPGKNIIALPKENPAEVICEVEPTTEHQEYSLAVAIIDRSEPHFHQITTETYKITKGELDLIVDGTMHHLSEGDSYVIKPGSIHQALGNETWIECKTEPGWKPEDHILAKEII
ncbi:MAG TPA: cupin domain-containing protein [Patescibacteria group bacterium]